MSLEVSGAREVANLMHLQETGQLVVEDGLDKYFAHKVYLLSRMRSGREILTALHFEMVESGRELHIVRGDEYCHGLRKLVSRSPLTGAVGHEYVAHQRIVVNPYSNFTVRVRDLKTGGVRLQREWQHIVLGHEMIHAVHHMQDRTKAKTEEMAKLLFLERGLSSDSEAITESSIELQLPLERPPPACLRDPTDLIDYTSDAAKRAAREDPEFDTGEERYTITGEYTDRDGNTYTSPLSENALLREAYGCERLDHTWHPTTVESIGRHPLKK